MLFATTDPVHMLAFLILVLAVQAYFELRCKGFS